MDSSFTDEDEEAVAPLMERLLRNIEQSSASNALSLNRSEGLPVSTEDKKIEQKRDLSVEKSSSEPLRKKVKQDHCVDKMTVQKPGSASCDLNSGSRVSSSVGKSRGAVVHENHLDRRLKEKESVLGSEKVSLASASEMQKVQLSQKPLMSGKSDSGLKDKNSFLDHQSGLLLSMVIDSTTDGSNCDASSGRAMKLSWASKNGIKQKGKDMKGRGQNSGREEDAAFAVEKVDLNSPDGNQRGVDKARSEKRTKNEQNMEHSLRPDSSEDANMSPPVRPSKGKQLVTKNGKIKAKQKGTHKRDDHSVRDGKGSDEVRNRKGLDRDAQTRNHFHSDDSDEEIAASPVFKKSKHLSRTLPKSRSYATKVSSSDTVETEFSVRHSRHQSHEKLNLERKYVTLPKSNEGTRSCIHSNRRLHNKKSHSYSKDADSTSHGSYQRDERFFPRDKESRHHESTQHVERRRQDQESKEDPPKSGLSLSSTRGDEKPASSPRYNKFLIKNQKNFKVTSHSSNDLLSRSSGRECDSTTPSSFHKRHKRQRSQEHNVSSWTERVSSSALPVSERSSSSTKHTSSIKSKKSHRHREERKHRTSSEMSNSSSTSSHHETEGRNHRGRHDRSDRFSQGARSSCRFASGTSEISLVRDDSATSQNNSKGYDMAGIGTPRQNSEEFYVHDITSPDIFSEEDSFIEEVDFISMNSSRNPRRRVSGRGNHQSVTELSEDDDTVIVLDDEAGRESTPPRADGTGREGSRSVEIYPDGGNVTPRTAAAINQLEADEAMARRLQLEFDREEAYVRTPPEPEELGMTRNFNPGEGQFASRVVHSYLPELYSSMITFGMGQGMMPWFESTVETRTSRRGGNQRERGNRRRRHHVHIEHLYHQADDDYERLLELEEQLGPAVSQGLPPEILTQLPTFKFQKDSKVKDDEKSCTICMADYQVNEDLRRLPCFHAYHRDCIDRWFQNNSACPICRVRVELG